MNETFTACRTTINAVGESHALVMTFDGADRASQRTFTYRPNPEVIDVEPRSSIQRYDIVYCRPSVQQYPFLSPHPRMDVFNKKRISDVLRSHTHTYTYMDTLKVVMPSPNWLAFFHCQGDQSKSKMYVDYPMD